MNRWIRTGLIFLIVLFSTLCGLAALIDIAMLFPTVRHFALALADETISRRLTGALTIADFRTDLFGRIDLEKIKARYPVASSESLSIGRIRVEYSLARLIGRKAFIKKISIDSASVVLTRTSNGNLRAPFLPGSHAGSAKRANAFSWTLPIGEVDISRCTMRYKDSSLPADVALRDISCTIRPVKSDSLRARISAGKGFVITPWWRGAVRGIAARLSTAGNTLTFDSMSIGGDAAFVNARGTIAYDRTSPWNLEASVRTDRNSLVALNRLKSVGRGGWLSAQARWRGSLERPAFSVTASAIGGTACGLFLDTLIVEGDYGSSGDLSGTIRAVSPGGIGSARVRGIIPHLLGKPEVKRYSVLARLGGAKTSELLRAFHISVTPPETRADLDLRAAGRSFSRLPDTVRLHAVIYGKDEAGLVADAALRLRRWSVRLFDGEGNAVRAEGGLGNRDSVSGGFSFSIANPARLSLFFLREPVRGTIRGSGGLSGSLERPLFRAVVSGNGISAGGTEIDEIRGGIAYDGSVWRLDDANVKARGRLETVLPRFGVKKVFGVFTLAATGDGPFTRPELDASLSVWRLDAYGFRADSIEATGSFHDDTMALRGLRISKDSVSIACEGTANLSAPPKFFDAAFAAYRAGRHEGSVNASVAQSGDSLAGRVSADSVSTAILAPWMSSPPPVDGTLSLTADLGGTVSNPTAALRLRFDQRLRHSGKIGYGGAVLLRDGAARGNIKVLTDKSSGRLDITLDVPFSPKHPLSMNGIVRGGAFIGVRGEAIDAGGMLSTFIPALTAEGVLSLSAEARKHAEGGWALSGTASAVMTRVKDSLGGISIDTIRAETAFAGSEKRPSISLDVNAGGAAWNGRKADAIAAAVRYFGDTLYLDTLFASFGVGRFAANGVVPLAALDRARKGPPGFVNFSGTSIPLARAFGSAAAGVEFQDGSISTEGKARITGRRPSVYCTASIIGARMRLSECDPAIGPADARVSIAGDSVALGALRCAVGGSGLFQGNGWATLGGAPHVRLGFSAADARLRCDDFDAGVRALSLRISDSSGVFTVSGNIDLAETRYTAFFSPSDIFNKLKISERRSPAASSEGGIPAGRVFPRITLNLRRDLTVETNIGMFTLDGAVTTAGTLGRPGVVGNVDIAEGFLYYLDRKFAVEKGTIRFRDPETIVPDLDVTATSSVMSLENGIGGIAEKEYSVTLRVTGGLDKPTVALSSDPPLRPVQIIGLLTLGSTQGDLTAGYLQRMEFILAQQAAGFGTRKLEKLLNMERISVEPTTGGAMVTAAKRITSRLIVTYQTSIENIGTQQIMASYRLFPFLYLDATGDYAGRAGGDLHLRLSR